MLPASLARALASGRISPAYLLEGPDADALRDAAREAAAAILCPKGGCGRCRACRLGAKGTHPDLHAIGKDKPTVISVAALEPALARAHLKPLEGARQVFVVDPAEAMEAEGVARYLKALEEPPAGTVFLLVSTRPERLPETVLSRCRRVRLPPVAPDEIARRLAADGVEEDAAAALARLATGSPARGRRMHASGVLGAAQELSAAAGGAPVDAEAPGLAATALRVLSSFEKARAAEATEDEGDVEETGTGRKREAVRAALQDLLHALAVDARDAAAGRDARWLRGVPSERAIDLLRRLADLSAAVAANVTPAAVAIEIGAALRRVLTPSQRSA
jgi:DNA polymerase-3 subunit delta'